MYEKGEDQMTYGELKQRVLQLVFSDSLAGTTIPSTYNNQADYIRMIPGLLNSAQTYLYQIKPPLKVVDIADLEVVDRPDEGVIEVQLPDDCMQMVAGLIVGGSRSLPNTPNDWALWPTGNPTERFTRYRIHAGKFLIIPRGPALALLEGDRRFAVEYQARVAPVAEDVADSFTLENVDEVNEVIPYYIAAHMLAYDDAYRSAYFKNEFEDRLARLKPNPVTIEYSEVRDAYGPTFWWWD